MSRLREALYGTVYFVCGFLLVAFVVAVGGMDDLPTGDNP